MALSTINYLELCAGTGMLGTAVELALESIGVRAMPVCYIEREASAAASLVARMEVTGMGAAPVWDDIGTFDCGPWRGLVDCVCGGYPCQPFSSAGKRLGSKDERYLWPRIREIVEEIQPSFCFFENVPGHLNSGFDRVVEDLEGLDYRVAAGLFSSEEVGAPMRNERLYILASTPGEGREESRFAGKRKLQEESGKGLHYRFKLNGGELASSAIQGCEIRPGESDNAGEKQPPSQRGIGELDAANSHVPRPDLGQDQIQIAKQPDVERTNDELGKTASNDEQRNTLSRIHGEGIEGGGSSGNISEYWHYPPSRNNYRYWRIVAGVDPARMPAIERSLCGVAYGMASRADQLRLIGNGVDPLAAANAFLHLLSHFEKG